jgi:outer membrane protein TolC
MVAVPKIAARDKMAALVFLLRPMSCPRIRIAIVLLASMCAGAGAQDGVPVSGNKKMPSFKMTMPTAIDVPVGSEDVIPTDTPVIKKKDFFGKNSETKILTLSEALQSALRNNLDAKVEEVGVLIEDARLRNAYGEFDPVFSFSASRSGTQTPDARNNVSSADAVAQLGAIQAQIEAINANTLANQQFTNAILEALGRPPEEFNTPPLSTNLTSEGVVVFDQDLDRGEMSLQARSPLGTIIRAGVRTTRLRSTFEGDTRTITPIYTATTSIEARQPLLKDFGFDANLADVRIARKNRQAQELTWRFRLESTLEDVVSTYYEMLLGIADLENKGDAISAGLRLVAHSERRKEVGFFSPYEVQQAQVQLSFDRENLLIAKNFYLNRQYAMQRLILPEYQDGKLRVYLPAAMPSLKMPKLDREELLAIAFQNRLDYKAALVVAEAEDVRVKFAKNQRWPQLDVVGSYGWSGLDSSYNGAFNRLTHSQAPQWQLGVTGSFPLGGIQPRAQVNAALARKQQALLRVQTTQLEVGLGVERAIELIRTNKERLNTAEFTTKTAEEAVRVGFRRMEEGLISNFDLIEQQRRLYDARTRELNARAELNKSITQLWLATGTVLENLGISFMEEGKPAARPKVLPPNPQKNPKRR